MRASVKMVKSCWPCARLLQWRFGKDECRRDLLDRSEVLLYRIIQEDLFSADLAILRQGKDIPWTSKLFKMAPLADQLGLLRLGGSLRRSSKDFVERHPVILGSHLLVEKMVYHCHEKRGHSGVEALLAFQCVKFWIISGRRIIRAVKTKCVRCR